MSRTVAGRNMQLGEDSAQQSAGVQHLGACPQRPSEASLALWRGLGKRKGKGYESDAVEGSHSRGVLFQLFPDNRIKILHIYVKKILPNSMQEEDSFHLTTILLIPVLSFLRRCRGKHEPASLFLCGNCFPKMNN